MAVVARAIHHAHERGVLHRDLKPANILLDEAGEPIVSDFGAAKRIGGSKEPGQSQSTESGVVIGTPSYMAPERARGGDQGFTTAVDVFSLGVVLYQLITGDLPFEGDPRTGMVSETEAELVRPRLLVPKVPRDLETICLKCLEKDPSRRYVSAEELAKDLDRFLGGDPIEARPASLAGRAWRFIRRRLLAVGTIMMMAVVAAAAMTVAIAQDRELRRDALRTNAYAARALAGTVALHLTRQLDAVVKAASDPAVVGMLLHHADISVLERRRTSTPFDSLSVFDRSGTAIIRAPVVPDGYIGTDYSWRDYFIGARQLGETGQRAGYVTRAFRSEADTYYRFAVAAPIYDGNTWSGVISAAIVTDTTLGPTRLDDESDTLRTAVVVAPRDRSRGTTAGAGDYVVLLHEGLAHGAEFVVSSPRLRELSVTRTEHDQLRRIDVEPVTDDAYTDPMPGFEGRWLAGFAPVGETGFVVIVQTRYDAAVKLNARLWRVAQVGVGILATVTFGFGLLGYLRRRRRARARSR
jgi:serine/threonine-protein kinase